MTRFLKYAFLSLIVLLLQAGAANLLTVKSVAPDFLALWIIYLGVKRGQLEGTLWGFVLGLIQDFMFGQFIGLGALVKTICGFSAGYFYNENKTRLTLSSYRFLLIVLAITFIQSALYFFMYVLGTEISWLTILARYGIGTALYTGAFSLLPIFIAARRATVSHV